MESPETNEPKFETKELAGGKDAPMGYGPPTAIKLSRILVDWSKDPADKTAWEKIQSEADGKVSLNALDEGAVDYTMADFVVYAIDQASIAKVCRYEFNGFVDTMESVFEMYQDWAEMGVIPPGLVDAAKPMM